MERIIFVADYPYLTKLKLFDFNQDIASAYFKDLSLVYNEDNIKTSWESIVGSSMSHYPVLALHDVPPTTFSSSILTKLCITTNVFDDCLRLLNGRLKQLTTLVVITYDINNDLPNLKCFSLTCDFIDACDAQIVPLLRHMSYLEELTVYLSIENRDTFVDGTHLHNEILIHMPQLHSFVFYIRTDIGTTDSMRKLSNNDIQQTLKKIKNQKVGCMTYYPTFGGICHVFSIPFLFDRLEMIGNTFPNIIFNNVTFLMVFDSIAFKCEFFIRVARFFPLLKELQISNCRSPL
ncbi:unnamed protein product [Rotaria magnacalcarata]|uniref:Uncharacterized protein n=1 Tax=Rotaria magnacalcarata TaxID=392030 RepID=A0A816N4Y4_9BILA|nr:unnamed protein product [Rotaria magnacalcarata]